MKSAVSADDGRHERRRSRPRRGGRAVSAAARRRCWTARRSCARALRSRRTSTPAHLQDRQGRRRGQVEQDGRLAVDLHLERRVPRPAQQQDDAERGHREEEDDRRRREDRRPQQRPASPRGRRAHAEAPSTRAASSSARVEVRPHAAHEPHDDGHVVEDVGDDDGGRGAVQAHLRHVGPEGRLGERVERAARARAGPGRRSPRRRSGSTKGTTRERPEQRAGRGTSKRAKHPGHGQAQQQRQQGRDDRQAEGEERRRRAT